jgi:proteic killer suppression protein
VCGGGFYFYCLFIQYFLERINCFGVWGVDRRVGEFSCFRRYNVKRYILSCIIRTFNNKQAQTLFEGENPRKFSAFQYQAERKLHMLHMLDMAVTLDFLRSPPGNRLEALSGDRQGQYSIRINQQGVYVFVGSNLEISS